MKDEYLRIRDKCRAGLIKYLEKAFSAVPETDNPEILDIGCGTGVPTLWLAGKYSGSITAIDTDSAALCWLKKKAGNINLSDRLTIENTSFFDFKGGLKKYDIILAEGFLNIVGFEKGFQEVIRLLKKHGYFIIHDEFRDHEKKSAFIRDNECRLAGSLYLDENVWWNDYYKELEAEINNRDNYGIIDQFEGDIEEIGCYKADPSQFRSIYYLIEKL